MEPDKFVVEFNLKLFTTLDLQTFLSTRAASERASECVRKAWMQISTSICPTIQFHTVPGPLVPAPSWQPAQILLQLRCHRVFYCFMLQHFVGLIANEFFVLPAGDEENENQDE